MKKKYVNKKSISGFAFIDALIGITILGLGMIAYLSFYSNITKNTINDEYIFRATYLASEKVEQMIAAKAAAGSSGYNSIAVGQTNETVTQGEAQFNRRTIVRYVNSSDLSSTSDSDTGYKRIDVTVSWFNGEKQINFMGMIASY